MDESVQREHEKGHILISKLKEKSAETSDLKGKLEILDKEARDSAMKSGQLKLQIETVYRRIRDEELKDDEEKHLLQVARDYIRMTEERSQGKKESLAKALSELEGANERTKLSLSLSFFFHTSSSSSSLIPAGIHGFEDKIKTEKEERERLKIEIEKQLKELEECTQKINENERVLAVLQHREELKAKELASQIEARDELVEKFQFRLSNMEASADKLKDAISQANEEAVQRKEVLEKKITQVVAKDAKLRGEFKRHAAHADELRQGVQEKHDVVVRAESELIAVERELVELKATHDREIANLKNKLNLARTELREYEPKVKEAEIQLKVVNEKYENVVKRNEICQKETRTAESQCHIFENRVRELDDQQKETLESVKRLEHSLSLLDARYDEKVNEASEHRKSINEVAAKESFAIKVLKAEAEARQTLESVLSREREIIKDLEKEMKKEESEFEEDSVRSLLECLSNDSFMSTTSCFVSSTHISITHRYS